MSAKRIDINGVVQGVGFRPFLFVLAKKYLLNREVSNTGDGVRLFVEAMGQGRSSSQISANFHHTLVTAFSDVALTISKETKIKKLVLSGGVFNKKNIFMNMVNTLRRNNLMVYTHSTIPTGDGGISLGQAVVAAALEDN
ncbi:MAG: acylphosphatase [Pseudomonadota bacterium]